MISIDNKARVIRGPLQTTGTQSVYLSTNGVRFCNLQLSFNHTPDKKAMAERYLVMASVLHEIAKVFNEESQNANHK